MKRYLLAFIFVFVAYFALSAQVTVTPVPAGMVVDTLVNRYFAGGGVEIRNARFNGNATINSNQIGTFTNANTAAPNMPVASGIVMVGGNCQDAAAGNSGSIESSVSNPVSDATATAPISTALWNMIRQTHPTQPIKDVALLSFDFIPSGEQISFKYSFASEEYPNYVCSDFNDAFGFFISGPYDENGNPVDEPGFETYQFRNIALIPNTTDPVTINTVNGGVSRGSAQPCILTNTQYYRENTNNNCKMNGYTEELETERVWVAPCRVYKMQLAICDVGDNAYNSAVYLSANSFRMDEFTLSQPVVEPGGGNTGVFTKGCSHYDIHMYINRPATESETHALNFEGGDAVEGVDYTLTDFNGNPTGALLTFNEGDTAAGLRINFIAHESDVPGAPKTLVVLTEEINPCAERDTLRLEMQVPEAMTYRLERETANGWEEITGDIVYCEDRLPLNEKVRVVTEGEVGQLTYEWSYGNTPNDAQTIMPITAPVTALLTISDECSRVITDSVVFKVNTATTTATVSKSEICVGETVTLSTSDAVQYAWTSDPYDMSLANGANTQNPTVAPTVTTLYTVEITDQYTCKAKAEVQVRVIPSVRAALRLTPTVTTVAEPNIEYQDLTPNAYSRVWDFGDGQTSNSAYGVVSYSTEDTATYNVMLVAFNEANCPDTAYGTVQITPEFTLWIPNSFTPAAENINSHFGPVFGSETEYELSIYSRNGDRIFVSSKENPYWDGKVNGADYAPDGVYIYVLMYKEKGLVRRKTGTVNLMLDLK